MKTRTGKLPFLITGDVDVKLASQLSLRYGKYSLERQDYKFWNIGKNDIRSVIRMYANIE
jgi:hypothetical protein